MACLRRGAVTRALTLRGEVPDALRRRCGPAAAAIFALTAIVMLPACSEAPRPDPRRTLSGDREHGLQIIRAAGCGACHAIPGVDWQKGRVGPSLEGFGTRAMMGGGLPNRPDILVAYLRDAPSVDPASAMPPMPLTEDDARDAAAYLHDLR